MKHRQLTIATLAVALLAVPAIPVFADSIGWMDTSDAADGPACTVAFKPVSATEVESCYDGLIAGKPGKNCVKLSNTLNLRAVAEALQDGRDCARLTVYGV